MSSRRGSIVVGRRDGDLWRSCTGIELPALARDGFVRVIEGVRAPRAIPDSNGGAVTMSVDGVRHGGTATAAVQWTEVESRATQQRLAAERALDAVLADSFPA